MELNLTAQSAPEILFKTAKFFSNKGFKPLFCNKTKSSTILELNSPVICAEFSMSPILFLATPLFINSIAFAFKLVSTTPFLAIDLNTAFACFVSSPKF